MFIKEETEVQNMNPIVINRIKLVIYTIVSLSIAWQTSMSGVTWDAMGWEEHSCLVAGIVVLWLQTVFAYLDKGNANAQAYKDSLDKSNGSGTVKP